MKSILSKLWLGITSLVLIIILLLWIFQVGLLKQFYISERKNSLIDKGKVISSLFLENNQNIAQNIKDEIESFKTSFNAIVFIYDSSNELIYTNMTIRNERRNIKVPDIKLDKSNAPFKTETLIMSKRMLHSPAPFILVKVPIINNNELVGNVVLTSPLAPIEETVYILKKQLSIISLLSIIIATALALAFSRYFTKPILSIIEASKKIAKGDFTAGVHVDTKDELGTLGESINNMALKLEQTEKLRREFIANISHELKTPISLIKAYSEVIKDIDISEESKKEYLDIIIDESDRLNNMVEDILYLSKMEAGFSKPEFTEFYIIEVINNVKEKLEFLAMKKNISIDVNIDDDNTIIYADKNKMYQVFYNLINNSINHSFENDKVIVKVMNLQNMIKIEISDEGKGIPKEDLPYIWDRFYKVDKSRQRDSSGTGLGMAIVKNILDAHNFSYGIESEVSKGTTVWIEIKKH
ncbi:MAG: hypothetical protein PWQ37_366 [Candidatus Petromonas sp.]|nr:hypothetical protein [Candidatus Petromonas sp.]